MKRFLFLICLCLLFVTPQALYAIGLEVGVGAWRQDPQGDISYKGESLDLEKNLKYDAEARMMGRVKIDMPLIIPNIYLMATPMSFEGSGSKDVSFTFGNQTFTGSVPFNSKIEMDHLDLAFYYGLPFLKTLTAEVLNAEVGLNARLIDFSAEITQPSTGLRESKSLSIPVPMLYVGAQITPIKKLAIEAEGRGIAYSGDHYYSLIGRLKIKPIGPLFIAAGWRHDDIKLNKEDVKAAIKFSGPFAEAGIQF